MVQLWITSLLLVTSVASAGLPKLPALGSGLFGRLAPSPDVVTNNFVSVRHTQGPHASRGLHRRQSAPSGGQTNITDPRQTHYVAAVTWGNETYDMLLDTGSSDTWLLQKGYLCLNSQGAQVPQSNCSFAASFSGNYTGGQIGNMNFNATYGSGIVAGTFGWEDITIAGLTVHNAQVASVTEAHYNTGLPGLFGLAFSSLTHEYPGNDPSQNAASDYQTYAPVFYKMVNQNLSLPTFSFAPQRNGNNGYLAFGGIPPVNTTGKTASTPILSSQVANTQPNSVNRYDYYTIQVDSTTVSAANNRTQRTNTTDFPSFLAIVDTGTTVTYLPTALSAAIARSFNPPATYVSAQGIYEVPCNATAPYMAFNIGGVNFAINSADLIMQPQIDSSTGMCAVGFQDGGNSSPFTLGGTFLNNVLSTFDLGALKMRFTALAKHNWK